MPATRRNPRRGKFYDGDAQEKITTASSDLLFFVLELNRIDDAVLDAAMEKEPLAHYAPWLVDIRKEKPHQLDDKLEQLFLEKSVVGRGAWNRLFDETIASLRFEVDGEKLHSGERPSTSFRTPTRSSGARARRRWRRRSARMSASSR